MKTEEDEAFDELARRQGMWGGGFPAKRAMAADKFIAAEEHKVGERYGYVPKLHPSEWMDAQPAQEPVAHLWECLGRWSAYLVENGKQADCAPPSWLVDAINKATTPPLPAQEPVAWAVQGCSKMWRGEFAEIDAKAEAKRIGGTCVAYALYISPPQRPWVGLTDDELADLWYKESLDWMEFARAVEQLLRSKNA